MKRLSIIVLVLLSAVFLVSMVSADGNGGANFVGLWQGVDVNDGSLRTISISDNDRDGYFEVLLHDEYWSLCGDGRGAYNGFGSINSEGKLFVQGTLFCSPSGTATNLSVTYDFVRFSDTLIEDPGNEFLEPGTLHRISSR
ncbi:MAG: hypothetical protein DHS20C20_14740 [Ardenticatenaceae bacterium]|nr:MAG: hypothetical protein DHS20C20_14740 [Ardenticatenaceae bacterium]